MKEISDNAFYRCSNLTQVKLNEGLIKIGRLAFSHCGIKNIFLPESVVTSDYFIFLLRIPKNSIFRKWKSARISLSS